MSLMFEGLDVMTQKTWWALTLRWDMVKNFKSRRSEGFPLLHVESCGNELCHLPHVGRKDRVYNSSLRRELYYTLILIYISVTKNIKVLAIESD